MSEFEKDEIETFAEKMKRELAEIGLIKQEEKIKFMHSVSGKIGWEITLLKDPTQNLDRLTAINKILEKRFVNG